jgi:hypothetical protein
MKNLNGRDEKGLKYFICVGWDIGMSLATGYGMDGPGIKSWWGRDFLYPSRPALGPNQVPVH